MSGLKQPRPRLWVDLVSRNGGESPAVAETQQPYTAAEIRCYLNGLMGWTVR